MSSTDEHSSVLEFRDPTGPLDSPLGATLREWEQKVKESDWSGVVARWEFGRAILPHREGKQLPKGWLDAIVAEHGLSRSEIARRMQFAETFPTEAEVLRVRNTYVSWNRIKREALPRKPKTAARQKADNVAAHVREAARLVERLAKDDPNSLTVAHRRAYQKLYDTLRALLGLDTTIAELERTA